MCPSTFVFPAPKSKVRNHGSKAALLRNPNTSVCLFGCRSEQSLDTSIHAAFFTSSHTCSTPAKNRIRLFTSNAFASSLFTLLLFLCGAHGLPIRRCGSDWHFEYGFLVSCYRSGVRLGKRRIGRCFQENGIRFLEVQGSGRAVELCVFFSCKSHYTFDTPRRNMFFECWQGKSTRDKP